MKPLPYPVKGSTRKGVVFIFHQVVLSTGGTIASQDSGTGLTLAKIGGKTGRYTCTISGGPQYKHFLWVDAKVLGPTDAAYGATTTGLMTCFRNQDIDGGNKDGTVDLQFLASNGGNWADAEVPDNLTIQVMLIVGEGI